MLSVLDGQTRRFTSSRFTGSSSGRLAGTFGLCTSLPEDARAQWTSLHYGPIGVAFPSGFDLDPVDAGGAGEVFARYHFDGPLSIGAGIRVSLHDLENDFEMTLAGYLLELRYGRQVNGRKLDEGEKFFPFVGARVGGGSATVKFPNEDRETTTRGWQLSPVAGAQYWLFRNVGLELAVAAPFDRLGSTNGRSFVIQPAIVVGW